MVWITIAALLIAGFLGWNLYHRFGADRLSALIEKRRATSKLVTSGEFVDGNRHLQVALALTQTTLFYENADMEGSIDLEWVREIDYDSELATGTTPPSGSVLRLRSHSQAFEFVLAADVVPRWQAMLPPRREAETIAAQPRPVAVSAT